MVSKALNPKEGQSHKKEIPGKKLLSGAWSLPLSHGNRFPGGKQVRTNHKDTHTCQDLLLSSKDFVVKRQNCRYYVGTYKISLNITIKIKM